MVVCSCNRLTHTDIENAVADGATRPKDIYAKRGCKAQCGNCVQGVVCLLREARKKHLQTAAILAQQAAPAQMSVALSA
ncbi:MAG: (2Fe-2S)-binding protein [Acetobacter sp.]|uniref:(2Fe-2S)-binding protein n=1 Tax=Acetobacter sp. TaxID=440 RepID=UPI0039ED32BB